MQQHPITKKTKLANLYLYQKTKANQYQLKNQGIIVSRNVQVNVGIVGSLRANVVPETDCRETDEAEVERLQIVPAFKRRVKGCGSTGDGARRQRQVQHHPVYTWLPMLQSHLRIPRCLDCVNIRDSLTFTMCIICLKCTAFRGVFGFLFAN